MDGKRFTKSVFGGDGYVPDPLPPVPQNVMSLRDDLITSKLPHREKTSLLNLI
jgi:hypothetical protein